MFSKGDILLFYKSPRDIIRPLGRAGLVKKKNVPFFFLALALLPASARVLVSQDEALALAFPECAIERDPAFLTEDQRARASDLAGEEIRGGLVHRYRARREGRLVGTAYFDAHVVRTLPETLMVVVGPDGAVRRVEVLSFDEPEDYRPRGAWYAQFEGRRLDGDLAMKRGIRAVAGATLTARATTAAVRRLLAVHRVLEAEGRLREEPAKTPAGDGDHR